MRASTARPHAIHQTMDIQPPTAAQGTHTLFHRLAQPSEHKQPFSAVLCSLVCFFSYEDTICVDGHPTKHQGTSKIT